MIHCAVLKDESFQSLNRDSGCSDLPDSMECGISRATFQSLNRDSGCSDITTYGGEKPSWFVSIPQSGFWLFRPDRLYKCDALDFRFNPSIGILVVQT